ncbi:DUF6368 family protein [Streptomyces sp. ECR3.8]|uniref:DUF6368 family protein n=1 Tax=Streptomyces sp. ECR3.8 TaxID=3461009 RepID=UPI0040423437
MSGPTLVIELAEALSPAALREFRALVVGLSSHFTEKRPGFFDVNVPAERLGVEDGREEDWRKPVPLPLLGNTSADEELSALVGFSPQPEDWGRPFLVYLMGPGVGDENLFEAEHADEPEVDTILGFRPTHAVNVSACANREIDHVATACWPPLSWTSSGAWPKPNCWTDRHRSSLAFQEWWGSRTMTGWRWERRSSCGPGSGTPPSGWSSSPDAFAPEVAL